MKPWRPSPIFWTAFVLGALAAGAFFAWLSELPFKSQAPVGTVEYSIERSVG